MRVGDKENLRTIVINFIVVNIPMAYNAILKSPTLNAIKEVIPRYLLLIQFELNDGKVGKLYGDQKMAWEMLLCKP